MSEKAKESARSIIRMFAENEFGRGSVWPSLNRAEVAASSLARIEDPNLIKQGDTDLCGLACFVRSLVSDAPDEYARAIQQLFEYGTAMIRTGNGHYTAWPALMADSLRQTLQIALHNPCGYKGESPSPKGRNADGDLGQPAGATAHRAG
jgi:hypothetical protein